MDDLRVTFFGDSFVAGVGDPCGQGWVGRVVAAAFAANRPLTAYNLGVRHETSVEVAARWQDEAIRRLPSETDGRVVLAVGANDTTFEANGPRVALERSCATVGRIIEEAATLGLPVAVAGPPPLGDDDQQARVVALSSALATLCAGHDVPYWPVADALASSPVWFDEVAAGDGRHPAAGGYELLAQLLIDAGMLAWICAPAAGARATSPRAVTPRT